MDASPTTANLLAVQRLIDDVLAEVVANVDRTALVALLVGVTKLAAMHAVYWAELRRQDIPEMQCTFLTQHWVTLFSPKP